MGTDLVMCRNCGEFVETYEDDGDRETFAEACPNCGGTEFKEVDSETTFGSDGE